MTVAAVIIFLLSSLLPLHCSYCCVANATELLCCRDARLSKHVIGIHQNISMSIDDDDIIPIDTLKKFVILFILKANIIIALQN